MKTPALTLLVGFSMIERETLCLGVFKTDRCIHPLVELGGDITWKHKDKITKVIINRHLDFQKEYTKWYNILPTENHICMYSFDSESKEVIDQVDLMNLLAFRNKQFSEEILNDLGYQNQEHFIQKKFWNYL